MMPVMTHFDDWAEIMDGRLPRCETKDCANARAPNRKLCHWCGMARLDPPDPIVPGGPPLCVWELCDKPRIEGHPVCERHREALDIGKRYWSVAGVDRAERERLARAYYRITGTTYIRRPD